MDQSLTAEQKMFLKGKEKVKLSDVYGHIIDGTYNSNELMLVGRILKDIALNDIVKFPLIVFSGNIYVDCDEKESRDNF